MKTNLKIRIIAIVPVILAVFGLLWNGSEAAVDRTLDISAYVANRSDKETANGEYDVRFALYSGTSEDGTGGTEVWSETQKVRIEDGILHANLGATSPIPESVDFGSQEYYLGIKIGDDSEMAPRKRLGAVPRALDSLNAVNASNALKLMGAGLGKKAGDIPQLGSGGKLDAKMIPEITKVGTITSGTWEGDVIANNYIAKALTGKTYNGLTLTKTGSGFSIASGSNAKLTVTGNSTIDQDLSTTATPTFAGVILSGGFSLGQGDIALDTVNGNFVAGGNIIPKSDDLYDLGSSSKRWKDIHAAGNVSAGTFNGNSFASGSGSLDLGSHSLTLSGNVQLNQNLLTTSSPVFAGLTVGNLSGVLKASSGVLSGNATTSDLPEGSNLYYTDARARASFVSAATGLSYSSATGTLSMAAGYVIPTATEEANWNTAYDARVGTWNAPLAFSGNAVSLSYEPTNLRIASNRLDTVQDIATTASPTFSALALSNALASTSGGTGLSTYASGDMLYYSSGTALSRLAVGTNGQVLVVVGGIPTWVNSATGTAHDLLSSSHSDTIAASVHRGDLITGQDSSGTAKWGRLAAGSVGQALAIDASGDPVWTTLSVGGSGGIGVNDDSLDFSEFKDTMTLDANLSILASGNDYSIDIASGTLFVDSASGRIGIGTTAPSAALDVNGLIAATGGDSDQWNAAYSKRVDTWNAPLAFSSNAASLNYNATNLKLTGSSLDTIQDISSSASPTFVNMTFSQATGTAPFAVSSTTLVSNLNADYLDGHDSSYFQTALTDPVTGTGASGYIPYWNSSGTLTYDSGLSWNSSVNQLSISSTGSNPTISNPASGNGVILSAAGGSTTGQLRIVANDSAWSDNVSTAYFQIRTLANNNATFMGGTYGADSPLNRLQFDSEHTTVTNGSYTDTAVPTAVFEVLNDTAATAVMQIVGASSQSGDYFQITGNGGSAGGILTVDGSGQVGIGTASPSYALDVNGTIAATGGNSGNWNAAYDYRLVSASGTSPLTLTLSANALTGSIADATTASKGVASFNASNFAVTAGSVNTIQNISSSASPTFAGLTIDSYSGVLKAASGVVSGGATTSDLPEGTNLYYTDARARAAISSSATGLTYGSVNGIFTLTSGYAIPTTDSQSQWGTAYSNRVDTWNAPLAFSSNAASLNYVSANLRINGSSLDTIQDISSSASPTFAGLTLSGPLAAASGGTGISSYAAGDILYYSSGTTLSQLAAGTDGQVLVLSGGVPHWSDTATGAAHDLLSATHSDTIAAAVQRGDLVTGQDSSGTSKWGRLAAGGVGQLLSIDSNGDVYWKSVSVGDGIGVTPDSLDFSELKDTMTLDADLNVWASTNNYSINFDSGTLYMNTASNRIGIGTTSPAQALDVVGKIAISGLQMIYNANAAGYSQSLFFGNGGGSLSHTAGDEGYFNTGVGFSALTNNSTGYKNSALGAASLAMNVAGYDNSALGVLSLYGNTSGHDNAALGYQAGRYVSGGSIANQASNSSLYLGANAMALASGDTNEIVIGASATGAGSNSVVLGNDSIVTTVLKGNVGIGTSTPDDYLTIAGSLSGKGIHIDSSSGAAVNIDRGLSYNNSLLEFSTAGIVKWMIGNKGMSNENLGFYINGTATVPSIMFDTSGNVGIGTTGPNYALDVAGSIQYSSQLISTVSTGTAPFSIASATMISNLNADLLDGQHGSYYMPATTDNWVDAVGDTMTGTLTFSGVDADIATSGSEHLVLMPGGNVGIGTTGPSAKLEVAGGVAATSFNGNSIATGTGTLSLGSYSLAVTNNSAINQNLRITDAPTFAGLALFGQLTSTVATGTAPFSIASATMVSNLNADLLDGQHAAAFQTALTNPITGTGTAGYLAKFTGATAMTNSALYDTGSQIGIGTTAPSELLEVAGNIGITGSNALLFSDYGGGFYMSDSTWLRTYGNLSIYAGNSIIRTDGSFQVGNGGIYLYAGARQFNYGSGKFYVDGSTGKVGIGTTVPAQALDVVGKIAISGTQMAYNADAAGYNHSLFFGNGGGSLSHTTGNEGYYNTGVGLNALAVINTGFANTGVGEGSLANASSASSLTAIGQNSGRYIADGSTSNATSTNSIYIGAYSKPLANGDTNEAVIGYNAIGAGSNSVTLGNSSVTKTILNGSVGIGTTAPGALLSIQSTASGTSNPLIELTSGGIRYFGVSRVAGTNTALIQTGSSLVLQPGTGNVGIGTTDPHTKLDVVGTGRLTNVGGSSFLEIGSGQTSSNNAYIDLTGDTTYADYGLRLIRNSTGADATGQLINRGTGGLQLVSFEAAPVSLWTSNAQRLTVDSAGNVGIGTTAPAAALDVNGQVQITKNGTSGLILTGNSPNSTSFVMTNSAAGGHIWSIGSSGGGPTAAGGFFLYDGSGGGTRMVVNTSGYVGIGTTAPGAKLDVNGGILGTTFNGNTISTGTGTLSLGSYTLTMTNNSAINQNLRIVDAPTFAGLSLFGQLTSTVATGTAPFSIASATMVSNLNADLLDGQHGSYYAASSSISGTAGYLAKFADAGSIGSSLIYDSGANVGIGTTTLYGRISIYTGSNNGLNAISFQENNSASSFYFETNFAGSGSTGNWLTMKDWNGNNDMTWRGDGYVGIGTSSPSQVLDVYGKIAQNGTQMMYNADAAGFTGSFFFGNGGGSLSHTTGAEGYWNTAVGRGAMFANTTGSYNTATGAAALNANTTGYSNSAFGQNSLLVNTTGYNNTAIGTATLYSNMSGYSNTALGMNSLHANTTGFNNVAVGVNAGWYIADGSTANQTSSSSLYLGTISKALADGDTNEIVIGYNATGVGSNSVVLGNDSITKTILKGNVGIGTTAPRRLLSVGSYLDIYAGNANVPTYASIRANANNLIINSNSTGGLYLNFDSGTGGVLFGNGAGASTGIWTASGNVGIGTTSPQGVLNVASAGSQWSSWNYGSNLIIGGARNNVIGILDSTGANPFAIVNMTGGTLRISAMPALGNTTTAPSALFSINSSGNAVFGSSNPGSAGLAVTSGNVGIGTTAPGTRLEVAGVSATDVFTISDASSGAAYGRLGFLSSGEFYVKGTSGNGLSLGSNGYADRMFISTAGNVGIGTTSPSANLHIGASGAKLRMNVDSINAGIYAYNESSGGLSYSITRQRLSSVGSDLLITSAYGLGIQTNATSGIDVSKVVAYINNAGNVGIGTTSPSQALDVIGKIAISGTQVVYDADAAGYTQSMFFGNGGGSLSHSSGAQGYYNTGVGYNSLYSVSTGLSNSALGNGALRSVSTGYMNSALGNGALYSVSIGYANSALGTSAGWYIADGSTGMTSGTYSTFLGTSTKALADGDTNETVIGYGAIGAGSNSVVLGNDSITKTILKGNVGIGTTSPTATLDIIGTSGTVLKIAGGSGSISESAYVTAQGRSAFGYDGVRQSVILTDFGNSKPIVFDTSGSERMRIMAAGNVGIGTTAPGAILNVVTGNNSPIVVQKTAADYGYTGLLLGVSNIPGKAKGGILYNYPSGNTYGIGDMYFSLNATANNATNAGLGDAKMVIKSSGNVGIGTTAPSQALDVVGKIAISGLQMMYNANASGYAGSLFFGNGGGGLSHSSGADGYYNTSVGYNSLVSVSSGRSNSALGQASLANVTTGYWNTAVGSAVLYGVSSGYGNSALGVDAGRYLANGSTAMTAGTYSTFLGMGTMALADGDTNETVIGYNAIGAGSNSVTLGNSSVTKTILNGNVGIGTTAPGYTLDVNGSMSIASGGYYRIGGIGVITQYSGVTALRSASGLALVPNAGISVSDAALYVSSSGNVGIGTTSPGYKLDVAGVVNATGIKINGVDVATSTSTYWNSATGGISYTAGNVGIGTSTPDDYLTIAGPLSGKGIHIDSSSGAVVNIDRGFSYNNGLLEFSTAGIVKWMIGNKGMSNENLGFYINGTATVPSIMFDTSGNVGIGTTAPAQALDVVGKIAISGKQMAYNADAAGFVQSLLLGTGGGSLSHTTGNEGYWNTGAGFGALYTNSTGYQNTASGASALYYNTTGYQNSAIGMNALLYNDTGYLNSALGLSALYSNSTGYGNSALGANAGRYISGGSAGNAASNNSVYLGASTMALASGDTNEIVIGYNAIGAGSNSVVLGNSSVTKTILNGYVGIGTTAPDSKLQIVTGTVYDGLVIRNNSYAVAKLIGNTTGNDGGTLQLYNGGIDKAHIVANGNSFLNGGNVGIGTTAPAQALDVVGKIAISGTQMAYNADAAGYTSSLFFGNGGGSLSHSSGTQGYYNTSVGITALYANTTGFSNAALGVGALQFNTSGYSNSALGVGAGRYISGGSVSNTVSNASLYLGANTMALADGDTNETVIGYNAIGAGSNSVVLGNDSVVTTVLKGNVGIGTTSPASTLTVVPSNDAANYLFLKRYSSGTTDFAIAAYGVTSIRNSGSSYGASLNVSTGTYSYKGLVVRGCSGQTANLSEWQDSSGNVLDAISPSGYIGIGTTNPAYALDVQSASKVNSAAGYLTNGADYAEYFYTDDTDLKSGEVVCVDPTRSNAVKRCDRSGDNNVMGIVSTSPSIVGNGNGNERDNDPHYKVIGMLGQVPAKVGNENGAIAVGDSLTASGVAGVMRKANAGESTVGIAMEDFSGSKGTIQVLISRRNQSLTVEKIEEEVASNISAMGIQDEVDRMLASTNGNLEALEAETSGNSADIASIGKRLSIAETALSDQEAGLKLLRSELDAIKDQNQAIIDFATAINEKSLVYKDDDGDLDLLGGRLEAAGIVAGAYTVRTVDDSAKTIGEAFICPEGKKYDAGQADCVSTDDSDYDGQSVKVETKAVTTTCKIFTSFESDPGGSSWIDKNASDGNFVIKLANPVAKKTKVDWWIVEAKDEAGD